MKFLFLTLVCLMVATSLGNAQIGQARPIGEGNAKPLRSEIKVPKQSLSLEELVHTLLFQGKMSTQQIFQNWTSLLDQLETNDTVCDGQETFYNWDILPMSMRMSLLKKLSKIVEVNLTAPTNWANLSSQIQELLIALVSGNGKFNFPVSLKNCLSKRNLQNLLCEKLSIFIDTQLQQQLSYVSPTPRPAITRAPATTKAAAPANDFTT
jgi:hypothetical protein